MLTETESFFDRISMGKSVNARQAANVIFVFACLCIPGFFVENQGLKNTSLEALGLGFLMSIGCLLFANDIRNFAYGKKVHLDNSLYFDANTDNTQVRWISLVLDLFLVGYFCQLAMVQYYRLFENLLQIS
jgi:hypothetical protein